MQPERRHWIIRGWQRLRQEVRWLTPGLGVKRWFLFILAGTTLLSVGLAVLTLEVYRTAPETWWLPILSTLSLRDLDRPLRVLVFGVIGIGMILLGAWGMNRALLRPFATPGKALIDTVCRFMSLAFDEELRKIQDELNNAEKTQDRNNRNELQRHKQEMQLKKKNLRSHVMEVFEKR